MNRLPFENLRDSMQFQQLCAELLQAEGCKNVRGMGTGADQGNDFMFDLPVDTPLSSELKPFIAQCKWYGPKNSVNENEVSNSASYIDTHNATGILIITSSQFTGTAITKIESISRSPRNSYQIAYWNGTDLTKRLRKHPELINKFFYPTADSKVDQQLPEYNETRFLDEFDLHPSEKNLSVDTFPEIPGNEVFVRKLKEFAKIYKVNPPKVVLISGVIGAGKTLYGYDLLNLQAQRGLKIAYLRCWDYKEKYFQYLFYEDDSFLPFIRFCQGIDVLFFDDFGMLMTDKSKSLTEMAEFYINLVHERIGSGKLTLLAIPGDVKYGKTVKNFIEYLQGKFPTIHVGDKSIRSYPSWEENIENNKQDSIVHEGNASIGHFLGKSWLVEKYELIEKHIDYMKNILLRPKEMDIATRKRLFEEFGYDESREDEFLSEISRVKQRLDEYKRYISSINFNVLYIHEDGAIEIIEKN